MTYSLIDGLSKEVMLNDASFMDCLDRIGYLGGCEFGLKYLEIYNDSNGNKISFEATKETGRLLNGIIQQIKEGNNANVLINIKIETIVGSYVYITLDDLEKYQGDGTASYTLIIVSLGLMTNFYIS